MKTFTDFIENALNDYFGFGQKAWLMAFNVGSVVSVWAADAAGIVKAEAINGASYFLLLMVLVFTDWLTAVILAARYKKLESRKALKLVSKMVIYATLFVLSKWIAKEEPSLDWLTNAVITGTTVFTFASILKNLSLLGLLPAGLAPFLWRNIDAYKNHLIGNPPPSTEPPADNGERKQY